MLNLILNVKHVYNKYLTFTQHEVLHFISIFNREFSRELLIYKYMAKLWKNAELFLQTASTNRTAEESTLYTVLIYVDLS